ncbi:MAG TPA: hypothetical protein VKI99_22905 [Candidatus Dormibacteraeota bacterium]|nr:hypothetical protein [Candidatus Dormibacteraeota bacterium]
MDVSIGLPSTIPAAGAATVLEWARRPDSASRSSVSVLDPIAMNRWFETTGYRADLDWLRHVNPQMVTWTRRLRRAESLLAPSRRCSSNHQRSPVSSGTSARGSHDYRAGTGRSYGCGGGGQGHQE